jgi:hypothetical protein
MHLAFKEMYLNGCALSFVLMKMSLLCLSSSSPFALYTHSIMEGPRDSLNLIQAYLY